jgi:putative inorganic carbon (HCO3(-)) transporter
MEWIVAFLILVPAAVLVARDSSYLLDYAIFVLAFNRGIRRMVDYYFNGHFNPQSPISLTPLLVAGLMFIPAVNQLRRLSPAALAPLRYLSIAIGLGLVVGIVLNRFAAIFSLAEWVSSLGTMAFAATQAADRRVADRWVRSAGYAAIGVAAYGIWQYYTIPPWDGMWLEQAGMEGYMGKPEPTKMTLFSTMNERGPCGTFLAWAVIPMIVNARWRAVGGWVAVALLLWAVVLTQTRSNLIIIGLVAILYPMLSKGKGVVRLAMLTALVVTAATWGMGRIPGMEQINERFGGESLYGQGSSFQSRLTLYQIFTLNVLTNPLGRGLGSTGMGQRVEQARGKTVETSGDSGYVQIFMEFGWIGGALFFSAMWLLWKELTRRWEAWTRAFGVARCDPFVMAARSILLGAMVFLFVGDIFAGYSLLWVFFGRALSPMADANVVKKILARAQPAGAVVA